jgi:hypothetical protein
MIKYLLIILFLTGVSYGQEIRYNKDGSVDLHFKTKEDWESHKKTIIFLNEDVKTKDSLITYYYKPFVAKQEQIINNRDTTLVYYKSLSEGRSSQIKMLEQKLMDFQPKPEPFFKWIGFYTGILTSYNVADSVINKETIVNALWNNLAVSGRGIVKVGDFMLTPSIIIPLKYKMSINLEIGYRCF